MALPDGLRARGIRTLPELFDALAAYRLGDLAGRITCPTLLLVAEGEGAEVRRQADRVHTAIVAPKKLELMRGKRIG